MARILIADDEKMVLASLRRALEGAGHQVHEAHDGLEAVEFCRITRPDVVVCDIFMPKKEGLETIKEIWQQKLCTKIIAMSGKASVAPTDFLHVAKILGAAVTFEKPLNLPKVVEAVEYLLGEPAAEAEGVRCADKSPS